MSKNTFEVDQRDTSSLGKSVKDLHNQFQTPCLVAIQTFLKSDKDIKEIQRDRSISAGLLDTLPAEAFGGLNKPESLSNRTLGEANKEKYFIDDEKKYLERICETSSEIAGVTAKMLLALDEDGMTKETLQKKFSEAINDYKGTLTTQTAKDMPRSTILVKDENGEVKPMSIDKIDKLDISSEQKDFIKTAWHQGTFVGGWIAGAFPIEKAIESSKIFSGVINNNILIDLSSTDKVKIYSSTDSMQAPNADPRDKSLQSKGTLEVDISNLKGDSFTPCISTNPVTINAVVTEFDSKLSFEVKSGYKADSNIHDYVRNACIEGELNAMISNHRIEIVKLNLQEKLSNENAMTNVVKNILDSKESEEVKQQKLGVLQEIQPELLKDAIKREYAERVSNDPSKLEQYSKLMKSSLAIDDEAINSVSKTIDFGGSKHVSSIKVYCKIENDPKKREKFAATQLDKFSATCTSTLDDKETDRIKKVVIDIMTPLCKNTDEKKALEANAGKMVRECASQAGVNKSWNQAWSKFKDGVENIINYVMGKENKAEKIMSEHTEIKDSLTKAMKQASEKPKNKLRPKKIEIPTR